MRGICKRTMASMASLTLALSLGVSAPARADEAAKDPAGIKAKYVAQHEADKKAKMQAETKAAEDPANLFLDATPILDARLRFELVDQDGLAKNANALTLRTRAGFTSGHYYGFGLGFDGEWVETIGSQTFNNTVNGRTSYPIVADPDDLQVNQLYLEADGTVEDSLLRVGRQRIIWDNARFIGNVGFRQNEQTFDAVRIVTTAVPFTEIEYVFLDEVHRIFGSDSAVGDLKMNSHGLRVQFKGLPHVTLTPFALMLDYESSSLNSSDRRTYGLLLNADASPTPGWTLRLDAAGAYQVEHADSPTDVNLWYYQIEPGVTYKNATLKIGYEVLEGDGALAFQTPLATLHKFNGFTDKFLTTPADGLQDFYVALSVGLPGEGALADISISGGFHQYWADNGDSDYGSEWDAGIFKTFKTPAGKINLGAQYASYTADNFATDTDKLWLTVQFQLAPKPVRAYLDGK